MKKLDKLEALRGFASIYVAIGHWVLQSNMPSKVKLPFKFGQEAVIIFFILSGFVIGYSNIKNKNNSVRGFLVKRFRRIYFPFICAILISLVISHFLFSSKELIGNLLMLQDFGTGKPGNIVSAFAGNAPLWSLSYEWIFYLLFPFIYPVIGRRNDRGHIVGLFSFLNLIIYILFPHHIFLVMAYFLIWWAGLELCEYFILKSNNYKLLIPYFIITIALLAMASFIQYRNTHRIEPGIYPYLLLRHFSFALIILISAVYFTSMAKLMISVIYYLKHIAPISYGIYVIHYPILIFAKFSDLPILDTCIKTIVIIGLSYLIEIKLQPIVNRLIK